MNTQLKQKIILAFQKTLISDKASIDEGSALLSELKEYEGCCLVFMEIADDENSKDQIRQASAIQLKLTIQNRWKSKKIKPLSENQKNTIRQFLLTAFLRSHRNTKILAIYKVIVKTIIEYDYKTWIPANDVILQIQKDPTTVPGCLYFLEAIFNGASKLIQEQRVYIQNLIELVFPHLYEIIKTQSSLEILFLISKIIWRGYKNIIQQKAQQESFKFMQILKNIIQYYDPNLASLYNGKIQKHTMEFYYFHSKKWACRTLWRFFQSHANTSYLNSNNTEFSNKWFAQFGQTLINTLIQQIPIPSIPKTKFFQIKTLVCITNFKYELIDSHAYDLLFKTLIPFILLTPQEEEMAKEEPLEYLRSEQDPIQQNTNVKSVVTDLWVDLAGKKIYVKDKLKKKKQAETLPKFLIPAMEFLKQNLQQGDMIHKQMAMYLLCKMHRVLQDIQQVKSAMPILIKSYVLPHFNNEIMLLRARAAELFSQYGHINFQDQSILKQAVQGIYYLMTTDTNPVVKLKASYAFNCVLRDESSIAMVKPYLKQILSSYIKLLNEYQTQSLVNSLSGIVTHFADEIGIFAVDLVKHLNNLFSRYCGIIQVQSNWNASIDVEMAAGGCIQAIKRIVDSPLTTTILQQMQPYIISIIQLGFTRQGSDYCNDILYLLSAYVTKIPSISRQMWFFYPCLFYLSVGVPQPVPNKQNCNPVQQKIFQNIQQNPNSQLFQDAMPAIRSYIYKGFSVLASENDFYGVNLFMLVFNTANNLYQNPSQQDNIKATITALMTYIVQNVKESSQLIPLMWQIIKRNMSQNTYRYLRVINSQLACMCIYSNPQKFLQLVQSQNSTQILFSYIFHPDSLYLNQWQKQRIVLGLSKILTLPHRSQQILAYVPKIMDQLKKHINSIAQIRDQKQKDQGQQQDDQYNYDADDDLDNDLFWEEPREDDFKTSLDSVDEVEYYEQCIKVFRQQEPDLYSQLMAKYTAEELQELNESINSSKTQFAKRRNDIARNLAEMASKNIAY